MFFIIVLSAFWTFQLSATDQLTSHFCFPEADEWQPVETYSEYVSFMSIRRYKFSFGVQNMFEKQDLNYKGDPLAWVLWRHTVSWELIAVQLFEFSTYISLISCMYYPFPS
jgi:hypothetical protein